MNGLHGCEVKILDGTLLISAVVGNERFSKAPALLKTKDAHGLYRKYGFLMQMRTRVMYRVRVK